LFDCDSRPQAPVVSDAGRFLFKTAAGEDLMVASKGNTSKITIQNVFLSNDAIHVIDTVLLPAGPLR
jgi:uncharacterized surface protein with fasciclin (FAS1) repeats